MMRYFIVNPLITIGVSTVSTLALTQGNQYHLGPEGIPGVDSAHHEIPRVKCPLPRPVDPSGDGLLSSEDVFSGTEALELLVDRHQPLVRIESVCYDDLGSFEEDERWRPFGDIRGVLKDTYTNV